MSQSSHSPWTSASGPPPDPNRDEARWGLVFPSTKEEPYRWGNLLPYFWLRLAMPGSDGTRDAAHLLKGQLSMRNLRGPSHEATESRHLRWSHGSHESFYTWDFLEPYITGDRPKLETLRTESFGAEGHSNSSIGYGEFETDEARAVGRLTNIIKTNGFAFVTEVPTDSGEPTEELLRKIAFIRETHYGRFYDFIPDLAFADTAYTNLALAAHTDNTYFTDPSGLQALHLLSHTDSGSQDSSRIDLGGRSLLVDGFRAAEILKREEPEFFEILASVELPWHASGNEGITIAPDKLYPVLECDATGNTVHRIRWNNADRGVVPLQGKFTPTEWYRAARKWDEILRRKDLEYWFQLKPGNVLIFDNWRVLHGRSAFTGMRRMCGGYINHDDFISRWRNTNYPRDEILKRIIG